MQAMMDMVPPALSKACSAVPALIEGFWKTLGDKLDKTLQRDP
jgi:hypothetical protein